MSTNCLVTKLKSRVENNDLSKLGALTVYIKGTLSPVQATNAFNINMGAAFDVDIDVPGTLSDANLIADYGTSHRYNNPNNLIGVGFKSTENTRMFIYNKYILKEIVYIGDASGRNWYFNLNDLSYCSNLTRIEIGNSPVIGSPVNLPSSLQNIQILNNEIDPTDVSFVNKMPNLTKVVLSTNKLIGSVENITNISITNMGFNNAVNLGGNIEVMLVELLNRGKTTSLSCNISNSNVKFHGASSLNISMALTATFDTNSIILKKSGNIVATYDGSTWTYA